MNSNEYIEYCQNTTRLYVQACYNMEKTAWWVGLSPGDKAKAGGGQLYIDPETGLLTNKGNALEFDQAEYRKRNGKNYDSPLLSDFNLGSSVFNKGLGNAD